MTLREAFEYEFSRLDPTGPHIDPSHIAVYELLMVKGPDYRPQPGLAASWEVSDDGLTWRVHLKHGVRFHSGAACDAAAALAALDYLRTSFPEGDLWYWEPVEDVRADGPETLVFELRYPYVRLPSLLWGTHSTIYNEALRAAEPDRFGFELADGTGPFRFESWSPELTSVVRYDGYHGPAPRLERIEWVSILDEQERLDALERGDVHIAHCPPPAEIQRLREDGRFRVVEFPQASTFYLGLDWRRRDLGFHDLRVRRAISLALDRDAIVERAFAGHGAPIWGPIPPGDEHYDPSVDAGRARDLAQARALLREARGDAPLRFPCLAQEDPVFRRVADAMTEQLLEIGVWVDFYYEKPFLPFYDAAAGGPAAVLSKWLWPDGVDAFIGFAGSRYQGFPNFQYASIPSLDEAFDVWLRAGTEEELRSAASRVQQIAAEELPYVPIATPNDVWVHTTRLHGFEPYQADLYPRYGAAYLDAAS